MISQKEASDWNSFYYNQLPGMRLCSHTGKGCLSWELPISPVCSLAGTGCHLTISKVKTKEGAMRTLRQADEQWHGHHLTKDGTRGCGIAFCGECEGTPLFSPTTAWPEVLS